MLNIVQTVVILLIGAAVLLRESAHIMIGTTKTRIALVDSCALIDGRIIELARLGFMPPLLVIPAFITRELQLLADGADSHKRERARFGLEVVKQLQAEPAVTVKIDQQTIKAKTTDDKLVSLAKKLKADLCTTDFNLNQVASIEGVRVLNVNELAHALRPIALPGEPLMVKILQIGSNHHQGVGYLDDGTMIVVDNAAKDIGKKIQIHVTRTHQTVAGKMLFGQKMTDQSLKLPKLSLPRD